MDRYGIRSPRRCGLHDLANSAGVGTSSTGPGVTAGKWVRNVPDWTCGRGRPPQAAAHRAGLELVWKVLPALIRVGTLRGWSDPDVSPAWCLEVVLSASFWRAPEGTHRRAERPGRSLARGPIAV